MKLIVFLLALAGAVFGGKHYLERQYEKELDKFLRLGSGTVFMQYADVEIGLNGISVRDFSITPAGTNEPVLIENIRFTASDPLFPLKGPKVFAKGKFPAKFGVKADNIGVSASLIETIPSDQHCKSVQALILYSEIGIDRVTGDLNVRFDFSDPQQSAMSIAGYDQALFTELELSFDASAVNSSSFANSPLPLTDLRLVTEMEKSYADPLVEYCAGKFNVSKDDFLNRIVASKKFAQNSFGTDLGAEFGQAFAGYVAGNSRLTIQSKPSDQLKRISDLGQYDPAYIARLLNLSASFNGDDVAIELAKPAADSETEIASEAAKQFTALLEGKPFDADAEAESVVVKKTYQQAPVIRAQDYLDRPIRIVRTGLKSAMKGRLIAVNNGALEVLIFRHSGEIVYKVPFSEVSKFEVLR